MSDADSLDDVRETGAVRGLVGHAQVMRAGDDLNLAVRRAARGLVAELEPYTLPTPAALAALIRLRSLL